LPVAGFFTLNGGLSSCEPIRSLPFVWIAYWYVESSNFGALALALAAGWDAAGVLAPPQAAAKTIASATPTVRVMPRMFPSFRRSVPDDLAQELLRALLPGGVGLLGDADLLEEPHRPVACLGSPELADLERREHDVLDRREVGKKVERLEDHADVLAQAVHVDVLGMHRDPVDHERPALDR